MSAPLTPEQLAAIRERAALQVDENNSIYEHRVYAEDVPALLAEVERLRVQASRARTLARVVDQYPVELGDVVTTWDPARYRALNRLAARYQVAFAGLLGEERGDDTTDEQQEDGRG